MGRENVWDLVN